MCIQEIMPKIERDYEKNEELKMKKKEYEIPKKSSNFFLLLGCGIAIYLAITLILKSSSVKFLLIAATMMIIFCFAFFVVGYIYLRREKMYLEGIRCQKS